MKDLKVSIIQSNLHWENVDKNLEMFGEKISGLKDASDLVVLPEMFNTGFSMRSKELAELPEGKTMQWMAMQARKKNTVVTGSLIIQDRGNYFNRLIWMLPDGTYSSYDKRHLFRMAGEQKHFSFGKKRLIVNLNGWKICPLICYDLRFPVWSRNKVIKGEPEFDCLLYVANWPERRNFAWKTLLPARAIENQCYVVGVNRIGKDGQDQVYSGDSGIFDPKGALISITPPFLEDIETVSFSFNDLKEYRKLFPAGLDADDFELKNSKATIHLPEVG